MLPLRAGTVAAALALGARSGRVQHRLDRGHGRPRPGDRSQSTPTPSRSRSSTRSARRRSRRSRRASPRSAGSTRTTPCRSASCRSAPSRSPGAATSSCRLVRRGARGARRRAADPLQRRRRRAGRGDREARAGPDPGHQLRHHREGVQQALQDRAVVAYPDDPWLTPWQDSLEMVGKALGRSEQADEVGRRPRPRSRTPRRTRRSWARRSSSPRSTTTDMSKIDFYMPGTRGSR